MTIEVSFIFKTPFKDKPAVSILKYIEGKDEPSLRNSQGI